MAPVFTAIDGAPELIARDARSATAVIAVATRLTRVNPRETASRRIPATMLPLIDHSPEGRRFSAMIGPRALMAGYPPARCPALAAASAGTLPDAIGAALALCRDRLAAAEAEGCGCRLLAADSVLLAPRPAFAYAPGLTVRLLRNGRLSPVRYVAVEEPSGETVIYAGDRPAFRLDAAGLSPLDPDGPAVPATRAPLALDRGRIVERVEAGDLTLLIGF